MTVTDLKPQIKNPERYNVYCDGVYYCSLMLESIVKAKLNIGRQISEEELDEILGESEVSFAFDKALGYLSKKRCSEKEVYDNLRKKGFEETTIARVIAKCREYSYLDDAAYARTYVQSYRRTKGEFRLRSELRQKGVADRLIDAALGEVEDFDDSARALAEKYLKGRQPCAKTKAGLYCFLAAKGFQSDTDYSILNELCEGEEWE